MCGRGDLELGVNLRVHCGTTVNGLQGGVKPCAKVYKKPTFAVPKVLLTGKLEVPLPHVDRSNCTPYPTQGPLS